MNKAILFGVLPALAAFVYTYQPQDIFKPIGCAATVLAVGVSLSYCDDKNEPLIVDNPVPKVHPVDLQTALERVKTALLKEEFQGYKWRLLQFDPDLRSIKACLDVLDLEVYPGKKVEEVRREVFLIADFEAREQQTLMKLRFHVRCGKRRDFGTEAVHSITAKINTELMRQTPIVETSVLAT